MALKVCIIFLHKLQDVGFQHGKLVFTGWARGDIIQNMLRDHRSADYNDSKRTDVRRAYVHLWSINISLMYTLMCTSL